MILLNSSTTRGPTNTVPGENEIDQDRTVSSYRFDEKKMGRIPNRVSKTFPRHPTKRLYVLSFRINESFR